MRAHLTAEGWNDYQHSFDNDPAILFRINALIKDAHRNPFRGLGKPKALKGDLSGWWSRRSISEHRLVYRVAGKAQADQRIDFAMSRSHYL